MVVRPRNVLVGEEAGVPGESVGSRTSKKQFKDTKMDNHKPVSKEAYNAMTK